MRYTDSEIMNAYSKVILNMDEEITTNEEYMRIYNEYQKASELLMSKLPEELKADFLKYDSAEGDLLAFFELYFFKRGWERK